MDWYEEAKFNPHISVWEIPLLYRLDDMRSDEPVAWCLATGFGYTQSIATRLGWPYNLVEEMLGEYLKEGLVRRVELKKGAGWQIIDRDWLELTDYLKSARETGRCGKPKPEPDEHEPIEISPAERQLVRIIGSAQGPLTTGELADLVERKYQTTYRQLRKLAEIGYVFRKKGKKWGASWH